MASPSGSFAETLIVTNAPATTETLLGACTTGARSTLATVIAVVAERESAFCAVKVTL